MNFSVPGSYEADVVMYVYVMFDNTSGNIRGPFWGAEDWEGL